MESYQLLENDAQCLIKGVHKQDLLLFTWGNNNNYEKNRQAQANLGVDGIIYDR